MRYYSRLIYEKLIPEPVPADNAIGFPSGNNPIGRKFLSLGAGVNIGASGYSQPISVAYMAKNNTNSIAINNPGSSINAMSNDGGTTWLGFGCSGVTGAVGVAGDGSYFGTANQAVAGPSWLGQHAASSNRGTRILSILTAGPYYTTVMSSDGNVIYGFNTSGTGGNKITNKSGNAAFTQPFNVWGADIAMTSNTVWCVRNTGGHQVAYSTTGGSSWTTIVISGSTTQTTPMIRVSDDQQKIFVVFDLSNAYSSTNGGSSWTGPFSLPTGFSWTTLAATKTLSTIGAVKSTTNGEFYYSTDMGATWSTKTDGSTGVPFVSLILWS